MKAEFKDGRLSLHGERTKTIVRIEVMEDITTIISIVSRDEEGVMRIESMELDVDAFASLL